MKFDKLINKLIHEMPDFKIQGSKYKTNDGNSIRDYVTDQLVDKNVIVYFIERHPLFAPNTFLAYFLDSEEATQSMVDGNMTPPIIQPAIGFGSGLSPFEAIWRKKTTDPSILGTAQGRIEDDTIYINFMTVRSKARRQQVNTHLINAIKKEFPGKELEYVDITKQGKSFKQKYETTNESYKLQLKRICPGYYSAKYGSLRITVSNPSHVTGGTSDWQLIIEDGDTTVLDMWEKTKKGAYDVAVKWLLQNNK